MVHHSRPSIPWVRPAPTPYGSPLEHLEDHVNRISDLIAAHLARAPERDVRRRGVGHRELVERAELRNADEVPDEAHALATLAEEKAVWIAARERETVASGLELPLVRLVERFGLSNEERDALLLIAAPRIDLRFTDEWADGPREIMDPTVGFILAVLARSFEHGVRLRRMFAVDAPLIASSLVLGASRRNGSERDFLSVDLDMPRRIVNELLGDASLDEELVSFSLLARAYDLTGGEIRNGILAAALEAASAPVGARCISHAMLDRAARAQLFSTVAEATSASARHNGPIGLA